MYSLPNPNPNANSFLLLPSAFWPYQNIQLYATIIIENELER